MRPVVGGSGGGGGGGCLCDFNDGDGDEDGGMVVRLGLFNSPITGILCRFSNGRKIRVCFGLCF